MVEISRLTGVGASEGVAVGPAFVHTPGELEPEREKISEGAVEAELERYRRAVEAVAARLSETSERLSGSGSEEEAAIFEAHVELAEDPELSSGVEERVRNLTSPEAAVLAVGEEYAAELAAMEDEYLSARADDVRDVARQIAAHLLGCYLARDIAHVIRTGRHVLVLHRGECSGVLLADGQHRGLRTRKVPHALLDLRIELRVLCHLRVKIEDGSLVLAPRLS